MSKPEAVLMGFKDFLRRRADEYSQAKADFELGCEIMGRPSDITSVGQRADRVAAGRKERARRAAEAARNDAFGNGEIGGDRNWAPPIHCTTADGRPVTVSFGTGSRQGQTLACDGHVNMTQFYGNAKAGKGHDHYFVDGTIASKADRGRYSN